MKAELELRQLRVFVTVAEDGAVTRAARTLGMSQSTVSETLSALERTLGTTLFRRAGKGPVLTPAGDAVLPYARRMLGMAGDLVAELAKLSTEINVSLVVSAVESLCTYVLPSRLVALREHWPKARLEVITGACAQIRDNVVAGRSDLGLVVETDTGLDHDSILFRARLLIVAAPTHPLAGTTASADALRRCDFYMSDAAGDYHQVLRQHFDAAGIPAPRTQALGSVEGVKRGIIAGGGALGLLPEHAVVDELRDGVLAEVRVSPALTGLVIRAVFPPQHPGSPLVDELVSALRSRA